MRRSCFKLILNIGVAVAITPTFAGAGEADNFTGRTSKLAALTDSLEPLDRYTNEQLKIAIEETNRTGPCSAHDLYLNVWDLLAHNPISKAELFAESNPQIKKYLVPFDQSIYGGVPTFFSEWRQPRFADFFILSGWFEPSIRLHHQIIGIDKLGHFFGQGWDYFQTGELKTALAAGMSDEEGMDGYIGSGVYSYGDLSANYQGLRFWRELLGGSQPYVSCIAGRFQQLRNFTWADYVSPAWDEALNCSKYVSPEMEKSVVEREQKLGLACPVDASKCAEMVKQPCANLMVSPTCFAVAHVSLEETAKTCDALLKTDNWRSDHPVSLSEADAQHILFDKLFGIATMPFHYFVRDLKAYLFADAVNSSL